MHWAVEDAGLYTRMQYTHILPTDSTLATQTVSVAAYYPRQAVTYTIGPQPTPAYYMAVGGETGSYGATTSVNARYWTPVQSTMDSPPSRIYWDGQKWILLMADSSQYVSYDGKELLSYSGMNISATLASIAYDPVAQLYVGVGVGGIFYGYDGLNWYTSSTGSDILDNSTSPQIGKVAWNGAIWVAVGKGTEYSIAYSYDGIHWTAVTDSFTFFEEGYDLVWNGEKWVAVGASATNYVITSEDGIHWV
jgi:hypothetical protein